MKNSAVKAMFEKQYPDSNQVCVEAKYRVGPEWVFEVTVDVDDYTYKIFELRVACEDVTT